MITSTLSPPSAEALVTAADISTYLMLGMHHNTKEAQVEMARLIDQFLIDFQNRFDFFG